MGAGERIPILVAGTYCAELQLEVFFLDLAQTVCIAIIGSVQSTGAYVLRQ